MIDDDDETCVHLTRRACIDTIWHGLVRVIVRPGSTTFDCLMCLCVRRGQWADDAAVTTSCLTSFEHVARTATVSILHTSASQT